MPRRLITDADVSSPAELRRALNEMYGALYTLLERVERAEKAGIAGAATGSGKSLTPDQEELLKALSVGSTENPIAGQRPVIPEVSELPAETSSTNGEMVILSTDGIVYVYDSASVSWQAIGAAVPSNMMTTNSAQTGITGNKTIASGTWDFSTGGVGLKAVTQAPGDNDTDVATTAFVAAADALKANLASPAFTGVPTAPTAATGTNTTQLATTAFANAAVSALGISRNSGNTGSIASGAATTAFNAAAAGRYEIYAYIIDVGTIYQSFATVTNDGTNARIVANNGASLTITLAGTNVQVTQNSGGAETVQWRYIYF